MRSLPYLLIGLTAFTAASCSAPQAPRAALECADKVKDLTRVSQSPEGKSCVYASPRDDRVELKLLPVVGGLDATLAPIEQAINAEAGQVAAVGSNSDRARIDVPGLKVRTDDRSANVQIAGVHIAAAGDDAAIRLRKDVRLRGEPMARERRGFRSTYMLTRDPVVNGFRVFGYQAGGPKTGPIAVAIVHARTRDHDVFSAARTLTRRNGGV